MIRFTSTLLLLFGLSKAQMVTTITGVSLDTKKNGLFIRIHTDKAIPPAQVTGWQNESNGWFYTTIHLATADPASINKTNYAFPVSQIDCSLLGESVQLGFKLAVPIEQFEFYHSDNPPEILASLRFPREDVFAAFEPSNEKEVTEKSSHFENPRHRALIRGLYFAGGGLTGAGFLAGEKRNGWEISVGMALIAGAYILDKFILGKK